MADYKDIKGGTIQNFAGDPPAPIEGQVWYDSTAIAFQYRSVNPAGSWSTSGAMNNGRGSLGSAGTQTSAIAIAGGDPPSFDADSESYNGSTWTELANLNTARYLGGGSGASSTAALFFGGNGTSGVTEIVESFNGTSWTEVGDLNNKKLMPAQSGGTQTAAISMGGQEGTSNLGETELFNGTSWTEAADLGQARYQAAACGPSNTANLCFGGRYRPPGTQVAIVESWDGTSWTEITDFNTARFGFSGAGTTTACLGMGGYGASGASTVAELWNGTAWAEQNDLSQARYGAGGSIMSSTASVVFSAPPGAPTRGLTEEWNAPTETSETLTD